MTKLSDDLTDEVAEIFETKFERRVGQKVPTPEKVQLGNDGVEFAEATVLYADLSDSTGLVDDYKDWFAAKVYKAYLACAAKIIRARDGVITAYDGDRVMAVFLGDSKNTNAALGARQIQWATAEIVQPAITKQYPKATFKIRQVVAVDTSPLFVARVGIRGHNDLVWVGRAANYAAKMTSFDDGYSTYVSSDVYRRLRADGKTREGKAIWVDLGVHPELGIRYYGSKWRNSSL